MSRLPALTPRKILQALQRGGFYIARTKGGHVLLHHPEKPAVRITIAIHNKDMKPKTLRNVLDQAGLSVAEFNDLL